MPRFSYTARDIDERTISGTMSGMTADDIHDQLSRKNLIDIDIQELNFNGSRKNVPLGENLKAALAKMKNTVPLKAVVFFTRQLATMLEAGIPISEALIQLSEGEKPVFKKIILQIEDDISAGKSLSDSMAVHPGAFSDMFIAIIRSGEASGALVAVLEQMAVYLENEEALRQKIKGALRYPTFIGVFIFLMIAGILWKLVPIFAGMYASSGTALPLPTQILVSASNVVKNYFPFVILGAVLTVFAVKAFLSIPQVRLYFDTYILKLPIYGIIIQKNIWARFCRTLALLMKSGTPILQAVEISSAVVANAIFSNRLETVFQKLSNGEPLSKCLRETGLFPRLVTQLTATGEKSGKIDALFIRAAEFYEREIKVTVDSLASIIEPLLIIVLGIIIGAIVIALYLPIFSMGKLMQ